MKHLSILIRICLVLALCSVATGCTSHATGSIFKQVTNAPPDMSVVYIYRQRRTLGNAARFSFWGNDQRLGLMGSSGYFVHLTNDRRVKYHAVSRGQYGEWTEALNFSDDLLEIDLEPGKTYYLRWKMGLTLSLEKVPESVGKEEMKNLRMIEEN